MQKPKMKRDHDENPEELVIGSEYRECGPLDRSDVEDRLAKQRPAIKLDRKRAGLE